MPRKGQVTPPETRAKQSAARMGWVPSAETRARMSAAMRGRPGRPLTQAQKDAVSRARRGKPLSPEHRAKLSAAKIGKPGPWLGKIRGPHSAQHRARQSESLKGKPAAYPLQRFYYKGIPFRSTYEVRVARAFDVLGMPWLYEPKRFDLGALTYLPDFYLPHENMYVEVKGYYGPKSAIVMSRMYDVHPDIDVAILQRPQIEILERVAASSAACQSTS